MRKLKRWLCAWLDFWNGRFYIVEYDATEAEDLGAYAPLEHGRYLLSAIDSYDYGASRLGVFRSRGQAEAYLKSWDADRNWCPLRPKHVTRIPKDHPLVQQSLWR